MTVLRPEGGAGPATGDGPGAGGEPGDWGVYEPAPEPPAPADSTLRLRIPGQGGRRAAGAGTALRGGTGRRRGGRARGPRTRRPEPKRVVLARLVGELLITLGAVMLLFVAYQLWWTNVQADASADDTRSRLEQQWAAAAAPAGPAPATGSGSPAARPAGAFQPGQGFAVLHVPKLGLTYPIAEGTGKQQVLDKGLVGHYTGTAMPADPSGNFAIAAHRTTHGQPFRKLAELVPGDRVVVETATAYYTYEVEGGIPETPPSNVSVILPVPKGSPFGGPGRYLTMTTCTPEFSARGRLIVFGKMVEERPRSQGQPPALG
ncbi:sortase A [Kitasatospora sp. MMS16-BH015]|uniref:class E sortase n=1 Tax=Kitasatospora sp. MMS16-BH015 TaxID=2018025 RepID=UPI000CA18189|nr:class E sortase [Kitasatospora sp. MMS16-BH015]AUG78579.1 sortase A [Kitasatospora sp. MMS16-BH015]